jgi:predicted enzyme involved in methoxymalonyl-ACP biosynthesis
MIHFNFSNIDDYLKSLGTKVMIEAASVKDLPWIHQLFTKTNQFNVTTKRYALSEIEVFIKDAHWYLSTV